MKTILVHVRDPQFYAIQNGSRASNGNLQIMGFPPLGIMSLSAVLKMKGHECLMFDQANPDTPNEVIIQEILKGEPDLVSLSFLSTTSYPYAKILARQIRAAVPNVKLALGGVFATLNAMKVKEQCPEVDFVCRGDGEQLILDLLESLDNPKALTIGRRSDYPSWSGFYHGGLGDVRLYHSVISQDEIKILASQQPGLKGNIRNLSSGAQALFNGKGRVVPE